MFAIALAVAAGILWLVLEGATAALPAAGATLIAALPLPYACSCLLVRRTAQRALQKAQAQTTKPHALALLRDAAILLIQRRLLVSDTPHIKELVPEGLSQSALLALAASAEQESSHPYAKTICAEASNRLLRLHRLSAVTATPHAGVEALLMGQALRVGRLDWLEAEGVKTSADLLTRADQLAIHGLALVGVALGSRTRGLIAFDEELSPSAEETIARLARADVQTVLLTHGGRRYGNAIAKALDMTEAKSLTKTDSLIRELQLRKAKGEVVALLRTEKQDDALEGIVDVTLDVPLAPASGKPSLKNHETTAAITIGVPASLPDLILDLRSISAAFQKSCRLALLGLVLLVLPSFGLLHAAGGPFLPPLGAAIGLIIFTLLATLPFLRDEKN